MGQMFRGWASMATMTMEAATLAVLVVRDANSSIQRVDPVEQRIFGSLIITGIISFRKSSWKSSASIRMQWMWVGWVEAAVTVALEKRARFVAAKPTSRTF